jgi:hypothetical protein
MSIAHGPAQQTAHVLAWWERRWFLGLVVLLSAVPLLWPDVPPLTDLPGHMGRYRVQLDLAESEALQRFYGFEWALIGNLGIDLLIEALAPLLGLELAVKLIVLSIPPITVAGFLWVAREVHGEVTPPALFAVPFAYNFPFLFGFVNFALAMGLAFLAFALWLRLARLGRARTRFLLFVPISILLWLTHAFGWGTLGVLAFSAELVRQFDRGHHLIIAGLRAGLHSLALAPPVLLVLLWRSEASGRTTDWFNMEAKLDWLGMALRDRWEWFDYGALGIAILLIGWAMVSWRLVYSRNLAASALFLSVVFVLLPRIVFGSAYADMRLAPYLFAVALIAIRFPEGARPAFARGLAVAGLAFLLVRTGGTTISMYLYDRTYDGELAALEHVPRGARLVSFVGRDCREPWAMSRLLHLPGLAIVRREAFSNDQWTMAGAQLLSVHYPEGWPFVRDPSQIVTPRRCRREVWRTIDTALAKFPRDAFDYVWLIRPPPYDPALAAGMTPVWRGVRGSVLYRIDDPGAQIAASDTPNGSAARPTR